VEDGGEEFIRVVGDHDFTTTTVRSCGGGGARPHEQCCPNTERLGDGNTTDESPA
jgi:hypothetical protein